MLGIDAVIILVTLHDVIMFRCIWYTVFQLDVLSSLDVDIGHLMDQLDMMYDQAASHGSHFSDLAYFLVGVRTIPFAESNLHCMQGNGVVINALGVPPGRLWPKTDCKY